MIPSLRGRLMQTDRQNLQREAHDTVKRRRCSEDWWGRRGGEEGDRAHSRGRPQEEHPDGPPLFVRVLGTPLRPGGTQGGVIHPQLTPPPTTAHSFAYYPPLRRGRDRGWGGDRGKRARPVTNQKRLRSNLKRS